jgi:hypothetical protein
VERSEILDWMTYAERREQLRADAMRAKSVRRVIVGDAFTFLFENRETVRYQVHEMLRAEQIVREADVVHELETYNDLLGGVGELGCSLLIGIEDEADRAVKLRQWVGLPQHVYARLEDGTVVRPRFDPRQVGDERLSSVQYLKFAVGATAPVVIGIDLPGIEAETRLDAVQRAALQADLDAG